MALNYGVVMARTLIVLLILTTACRLSARFFSSRRNDIVSSLAQYLISFKENETDLFYD